MRKLSVRSVRNRAYVAGIVVNMMSELQLGNRTRTVALPKWQARALRQHKSPRRVRWPRTARKLSLRSKFGATRLAPVMFKFKNRTPEDPLNCARVRGRIDKLLKDHYQACTGVELPSRLRAVLERLDEEIPESSGNRDQIIRQNMD